MPSDIEPDETLLPDDKPVATFRAAAPPPPQAAADAPAVDLSEEIARTVERRRGEQVTCRRVGEHSYRCNWWTPQNTAMYDNPSMLGSLVTTSRISQSHFLHVTKSGRKLNIRVDTRTAPRQAFTVGG